MSTLSVLQKIFSQSEGVFIRELYSEFLGEPPGAAVERYYLQCFNAGLSKFDALNSVIRSRSFEQKLTEPITLLSIVRDIMSKSGYKFVDECYRQVMSVVLPVASIQKKAAEINSKQTKFDFLRSMLLNPDIIKQGENPENPLIKTVPDILRDIYCEKSNDFLSGLYHEILNREPDPDERKRLDAYSILETYAYLISSSEFETSVNIRYTQSQLKSLQELLRLNDEIFVTEVYRDCLGREPDIDGFRAFVDSLKNGTSKAAVLRTVMISEEALKKIDEVLDKDNVKKPNPWCELWPYVNVSDEFRAYVQSSLVKHNLPFTTNILVKTGGIGDFIQMTAVAKALKKKEPDRPVAAIIPHSTDLLKDHPYIDLVLESGPICQQETVKTVVGLVDNVYDLRYISRAYGSWKPTKFFKDHEWYYKAYPLSDIRIDDFGMHVCELTLTSLGLNGYATCNDTLIVPDENIDKISGNYVVVCNSVGSGPGRMKCWTQEEWDGLISWLMERGLIPVQLGRITDALLNPRVIDLRGKTTLKQSAGYIKFSKAYIGVEGGLFHMAKAVKTPAIVIFSTTPSVCFAYPDTVVVSKKTCRPCWWTEPWSQCKCMKGCTACLNLPDWETAAAETAKLLKIQ